MTLTQIELEELFGVHRTTISRWREAGKLKRLAEGTYPAEYLANLVELFKPVCPGGVDVDEAREHWIVECKHSHRRDLMDIVQRRPDRPRTFLAGKKITQGEQHEIDASVARYVQILEKRLGMRKPGTTSG